MRKLTAGNKMKFATFAIIIIIIILVLLIFLTKILGAEKEKYEITKGTFIYDKNYEYIDLKGDAIIAKKWTGQYYLDEPETGLSYDLGNSAIAYDSIKNKVDLYGTFYEVGVDGEVKKTEKNTEIRDTSSSKLYKIEDRKYLIVSREINTETNSLTANNYLIIILDKSGNTLLLNNKIDIKTINALILETDIFKFDVANEKLIYNDSKIDLKKIIGSTNQYVEPKKEDETEDNNQNTQGGSTVNVGSNSSTSSTINIGGTTIISPGNSNNSGNNNNNNNNSNNSNNEINNGNNEPDNSKDNNATKIVKSASLRGITPGATFLDVSYAITDPSNKYQVVYLNINGGGTTDTISLDKSNTIYRITNLSPNTTYKVSLGYKAIKNDNTIEEVTEDVLTVKTLKLGGEIKITKITPTKVYFNVKLDPSSEYDNATISVLLNGKEIEKDIKVNTSQAINSNGWTSGFDRNAGDIGKITIRVNNIKDVNLSTSTQIY